MNEPFSGGVFWGSNHVNPASRAKCVSVEEAKKYYQRTSMRHDGKKEIRIDTNILRAQPYKGSCMAIDSNRKNEIESQLFSESHSSANSMHSILQSLIQVMRRQLKNPGEKTLFHAPKERIQPTYYTPAIEAAHKTYFINERHNGEMAMGRGVKQTWLRRLHVTPVDNVRYSFDRTATNALDPEQLKSAYKSTLRASRSTAQSTNWSELNSKGAEYRQKRLEHLLAILEEQQIKEIKREIDALEVVDRHKIAARIAKDRLQTIDWLLKILNDYEMVSGVETVSFLKNSIQAMQTRLRGQDRHTKKPANAGRGSNRKKKRKEVNVTGNVRQNGKPLVLPMASQKLVNPKNRSYSTIVYNPMDLMEYRDGYGKV